MGTVAPGEGGQGERSRRERGSGPPGVLPITVVSGLSCPGQH